MNAYAAYADDRIRLGSSSGGIFSVLCDFFLDQDGVVYGVSMTEDNYGAKYHRVVKKSEMSKLRGSKYFQAKMNDTFKLVKADLIEGKNVLFSGTGCQINGLRAFLDMEYKNLVCIDVICHGVPSPKLWRKYIDHQEKKYGKIGVVTFRDKKDGWKNFGVRLDGSYIPKDYDIFMQMFLRDHCLRPSCYKCHAKKDKNADITLADFWGIGDVAPEMDDGLGVSAVITRTDLGDKLFDDVKDRIMWKQVSYDDILKHNPSEYTSVSKPPQRDTFFIDMDSMSFEKLKNKYIEGPFWKRNVRKVKRAIKKIVQGTKPDRHKAINI